MAVIVALSLVLLLAMVGMVIDLGHLFVDKTELQNAADACALAAAKELTGVQTTQLELAQNAAITVGGYSRVNFQEEAVQVETDTVTFSASLAGPYQRRVDVEAGGPATVLSMKYARCELARKDVPLYFLAAMGFTPQEVGAGAVASLRPSTTNCGIPLGMCRQSPAPASCPTGGAPDPFGLCPGEWYNGKFEAGGGGTGNFNWIDFTPPGGGASELAALLAGPGVCNLNISHSVGQTGVSQAAAKAWNSRFGLYMGGAGNPQPADAPPDFSGYSYTSVSWTSQRNALADFKTKRSAYASYGLNNDTVAAGNAITGLSINNSYNVATHGPGGTHATLGAGRRLATAPIVDCSAWGGGPTAAILGWACVLMLHPIDGPGSEVKMEYLGVASAPGSPCATTGTPAGPGAVGPLVPALVQ